jgi:hypothetical protein
VTDRHADDQCSGHCPEHETERNRQNIDDYDVLERPRVEPQQADVGGSDDAKLET